MVFKRPSVDQYFLDMAELVSRRSTCRRHKFGAVLVREKQVLATGYNGAPRGMPHCDEIGCLRDILDIPSGKRHEACRAVHAEMNAIIQCAYHGVSTKGGTMYINAMPCIICAKMIINAGIQRVVIRGKYSDESGVELLQRARIEVTRGTQKRLGVDTE